MATSEPPGRVQRLLRHADDVPRPGRAPPGLAVDGVVCFLHGALCPPGAPVKDANPERTKLRCDLSAIETLRATRDSSCDRKGLGGVIRHRRLPCVGAGVAHPADAGPVLFQKVKTPGIAHVAYVVGNGGEAFVVDPRRDVDEFIAIAREHGMRITHVLETHRQEDFVLGSAELVRRLGAKVVSLRHELFGHSDVQLDDGEEITLASLRLKAFHAPGHTPESTCYAMYVDDSDAPWGVFTGDALFVGETGRTDLPDPAKTGANAGALYDAIHAKIAPLGDHVLLWPAHGAGSVCGGNIADRDQSTLGFEKTYNPVFTMTRDEFASHKVRERLPRPPYFATMERWNLEGGRPLETTPSAVPVLPPEAFERAAQAGLVVDVREPEAFASGHVPGSVNVWMGGLPVFGGWIADAGTRLYLVLARDEDLAEAVLHLARIGIDGVGGILGGGFEAWRDAGMPMARTGIVTPRELADAGAGLPVLDVREDQEFEEEGHIPGARHLYVGYVDRHVDRLSPPLEPEAPIAVTCSVGHRAGIAVSLLERKGFQDVRNLLGGMTAWTKLDLPREKTVTRTVTTPEVEGERR